MQLRIILTLRVASSCSASESDEPEDDDKERRRLVSLVVEADRVRLTGGGGGASDSDDNEEEEDEDEEEEDEEEDEDEEEEEEDDEIIEGSASLLLRLDDLVERLVSADFGRVVVGLLFGFGTSCTGGGAFWLRDGPLTSMLRRAGLGSLATSASFWMSP